MKFKEDNALGELGSAIGKGLLAGLAGTAAMTLSQMIEMKITKRKPSEATLIVAGEITGIKPKPKEKEKVSEEIHFAYGTVWGISRGIISLTGLKGLPASLLHFASVWGTSLVILPKYADTPPIQDEEPKDIAVDALHHLVYAIATGLTYDALDSGSKNERKLKAIAEKLH